MTPRRNPPARRIGALFGALILFAGLTAAQDKPAPTPSYPTFRVSAFADVDVTRSTVNDTTGLDFGELDPYAEARFSDSWSALFEGLLQRPERGSDAEIPGRRPLEFDVERLYVEYSRSDALRLQAGEINSGIVDWNERDQLPRFLQTPIDIPSIARRQEQGGAWPLHLIGGWASGRVPGSAGLRYGVGFGEGRGRSRDDIAPLVGPTSPAGLISVSVSPNFLAGWEIGGAILRDDIPAPEGTYQELDTTLSTSFVRGPIEVRGEWARMNHRKKGVDYVTMGSYALISTRLPGSLRQFRPYVLLDQIDVANDEPYLSDVSDQRAWAGGVRWDATSHLVLKFDFRSQRARAREFERRLRLEIAVAF